jgi:ATP/maltotriose-dependent transcriptional regulator MalT
MPRPSDSLARQGDNQECLVFARKLTLISAPASLGKTTLVKVVRPGAD